MKFCSKIFTYFNKLFDNWKVKMLTFFFLPISDNSGDS